MTDEELEAYQQENTWDTDAAVVRPGVLPDKAKLTDEEMIPAVDSERLQEAVRDFALVRKLLIEARRPTADAASEKAWHARDAEMGHLFDDAERWEDYGDKMIIERDAALEQVRALMKAGEALQEIVLDLSYSSDYLSQLDVWDAAKEAPNAN